MVFILAPLSIIGCVVLFLSLGIESKEVFFGWTVLGLILYFTYGFWKSHVRRGITEVVELDETATGQPPA
jgi:APA family basic amino acid/polyamine antiporter